MAVHPKTQLKCLYINAHSIGLHNKQGELETGVNLENFDLIAIQKHYGMIHITETPSLRAISFLERIGKVGGAE